MRSYLVYFCSPKTYVCLPLKYVASYFCPTMVSFLVAALHTGPVTTFKMLVQICYMLSKIAQIYSSLSAKIQIKVKVKKYSLCLVKKSCCPPLYLKVPQNRVDGEDKISCGDKILSFYRFCLLIG